MNLAKQIAVKLWGERASRRDAEQHYWWTLHPLTRRHINRRITGDPDELPLQYIKRRYAPNEPLRLGLTLGCGPGDLDADVLQFGLCERIDACDLSAGAIEVARERARRLGLSDRITYTVADLDEYELGTDRYDICFASGVLHHIEQLDGLLDRVRAALRPGGLLVAFEYTGEPRLQWDGKVENIMNRMLMCLPREMRRTMHNNMVKGEIHKPTVEQVMAVDPSEAVHGIAIEGLLAERFEILERAAYGATILQFLLLDILQNFSEHDPKDRALIDLLAVFEDILVEENVIVPDCVSFICRRPAE